MVKNNKIDFEIRIFILDLLDGRELTFTEIKRSIARDYKKQEYPRQAIRNIIWALQYNSLVSRRTLDESEKTDQCSFSYTITERGRERKDFYAKKIEQGN